MIWVLGGGQRYFFNDRFGQFLMLFELFDWRLFLNFNQGRFDISESIFYDEKLVLLNFILMIL